MEGLEQFGTSSSARMCPSCRPTCRSTAASSPMLASPSSLDPSNMLSTLRFASEAFGFVIAHRWSLDWHGLRTGCMINGSVSTRRFVPAD